VVFRAVVDHDLDEDEAVQLYKSDFVEAYLQFTFTYLFLYLPGLSMLCTRTDTVSRFESIELVRWM
jgi:hypothetical protein